VKIDVGQLGPLQGRLERSVDQVLGFDRSTDLVWKDEVVLVPSLDGALDVLLVAMCLENALFIGSCSTPDAIIHVARAAEAKGFDTVWTAEHVVLQRMFEKRKPSTGRQGQRDWHAFFVRE
jgi:hypothetical protein